MGGRVELSVVLVENSIFSAVNIGDVLYIVFVAKYKGEKGPNHSIPFIEMIISLVWLLACSLSNSEKYKSRHNKGIWDQ